MYKLLPYSHGLRAFVLSGKFFELFPEMKRMQGLYGRGIHHQEDVWDHTMMVYDQMLTLTTDPVLLFSALMHDYGKPTAMNEETKKFTGHEEVGYELLKPVLKQLKFNNNDQKKVLWLVRNHMWCKDTPTEKKKKWFKFFNTMEDSGVNFLDFMTLMYADTTGRKVDGEWIYLTHASFLDYLNSSPVMHWFQVYVSGRYPKRLNQLMLNGDDLLTLGVHPGPKMGLILEKLYTMVLADEIKNEHDTLLNLVKRWMKVD
jgi:tRNA nucleotidyltransferase (CCA-adding enzyme)